MLFQPISHAEQFRFTFLSSKFLNLKVAKTGMKLCDKCLMKSEKWGRKGGQGKKLQNNLQ